MATNHKKDRKPQAVSRVSRKRQTEKGESVTISGHIVYRRTSNYRAQPFLATFVLLILRIFRSVILLSPDVSAQLLLALIQMANLISQAMK